MVTVNGKRGGVGAYKPQRHRYTHVCQYCGDTFSSKRPHSKTCSQRCRTALCRRDKEAMEGGENNQFFASHEANGKRYITINTKAGRIEQEVMWS